MKLNYYQFCAKEGYPVDEDLMSEAISYSSPGNSNNLSKRQIKRANQHLIKLSELIEEGKDKYNQYIKSFDPEYNSKLEELIKKASGHPDNPSVQAAQRLLKKYIIKN